MEMMNISLPDDMKAFVEDQATLKGFGTLSEYIRAIIREVQETNAAARANRRLAARRTRLGSKERRWSRLIGTVFEDKGKS